MRRAAAVLLATGGLALAAPAALGHSAVDSTSPRAGSSVPRAISVVTVTFKARILRDSASIVVRNSRGRKVSRGRGARSGTSALRATLKRRLRRGTYRVTWRARSGVDGHEQSSSFEFRVR
jgi:methionine-rich copper-binding protein CopC